MAGFDNRSGFTFGDTILAPYAMPDQDIAIPQPCVIISSSTYNHQRDDVLIMALVVRKRPDVSSGEMALLSAEAAGLDKGATFRPVLATIEQRRVRLILGHLEERDRQRLHHLFNLIVGS